MEKQLKNKPYKALSLIILMATLVLYTPVQAEEPTQTPDVSFIGWLWNGITGLWDYWFKGELIETKPSMNKLGTAKVLLGWEITKQEGNEANFDVYVAEPLNKDTDVCLVLKEGVDISKVDLTAKPISNQLGQVTDKSVPMTLAYEPAKCVVKGLAVEGYKLVLSDPKLATIDSYVKIGTSSLILEYQNDSKIQYTFDWGETNITLYKNKTIDSNIYVYYNETNGKIDFGANDYSPILKNYTYVLNSSGKLVGLEKFYNETIRYPVFYNYNYLGNFQEDRQAYSFRGICDKEYSNCSWNIGTDSQSAMINFLSYGDIDTKSITNVSACATLDIENEIYVVNASLVGEDCIVIIANNITLNGMGYTINGTSIGGYGSGIYIDGDNIKVLNFSDIFKNTCGIFVLGKNSSIDNVVVTGNTYGIGLVGSMTYRASNNNITNSKVDSNRIGVYTGEYSSNNNFDNITMWNCSIAGNGCIYINRAMGNVFNNFYINYTTTGYGIRIIHDSFTSLTQNNIIKNSKIENINGTYEVYAFTYAGRGNNNTLLNVSSNVSRDKVDANQGFAGYQVQLIRQWWYVAHVNDTVGNNLSGVNVTTYNNNSVKQFNVTTNTNGLTTPTPITDYIWTIEGGGGVPESKVYYSLYNNTAVKTSLPSFALKNQTWNVTLQNNTIQDFTLLKTSKPNVTFNSQTPSDLNLTNFIGVGGVNMTYNISDYVPYLNLSSIVLYYKANSTLTNVMYYQNGTAYSGYFPKSNYTNVSSTFTFNLLDNEVLPGTYNLGEITMERTLHNANALSQNNNYLSIELLNVTNTAYSFFEVMANSTNIIPIYYCNSTYTTSSPITNVNCNLVYNIPANNPYDHNHSVYSSHQVIPFIINTTTGKFGTVKITPKSYFILRGAGTTQFFSIANLSRTGAMRTSANNGNSWTNQVYTVDSHLHQFDSTTSLWYYACASDIFGNQNCSTPRQDIIQLAGFPPSAPQVYSPEETGYSGTIPINYTESTSYSPNVISFYNISLMDSSNNYLKHIVNNNLNLGYLWDSSTTANGNYIIRVTACDNTGQCSSGYSELFTLSNFPQQQLYVMPEEKSFLTTETANVTIKCRMSNGSDCPVQTDCRITSYYPNMTILKNNQFMINSAPIYSYDFGILTTTGAYNSIVFCYNTINGTASFNFDIIKKPISTGGYGSYGYDNPRLPHLV